MRWCAGFLLIALLAGCGKGGAGSKNASSNSSGGKESSSKENGKVYTSSKKSAAPGGQSSGGGQETQLPQPADTTDEKASPASDDGSADATKNQVVVTPGVAPAHKPTAAPEPPAAHATKDPR